jgi:hypothetical protein
MMSCHTRRIRWLRQKKAPHTFVVGQDGSWGEASRGLRWVIERSGVCLKFYESIQVVTAGNRRLPLLVAYQCVEVI